jgi:hypothetical protein
VRRLGWLAVPSALLLLSLGACSTLDFALLRSPRPEPPPARQSPGGRVLVAAQEMIDRGTIVVGACWDYVNAVFNRAGFPASKRVTVYQTKERGPYADPALLVPGDWIYFVNHTFSNVGHSAIFVRWVGIGRRRALTIEYVGRNRLLPGRYTEYDISECYGVFRGRE